MRGGVVPVQVMGAMRAEVTRVDPRRCPWMVPGYQERYRLQAAAEGDICFAAYSNDTQDTQP